MHPKFRTLSDIFLRFYSRRYTPRFLHPVTLLSIPTRRNVYGTINIYRLMCAVVATHFSAPLSPCIYKIGIPRRHPTHQGAHLYAPYPCTPTRMHPYGIDASRLAEPISYIPACTYLHHVPGCTHTRAHACAYNADITR